MTCNCWLSSSRLHVSHRLMTICLLKRRIMLLFRLHNRTYDDDVSRKSMRYIAVLYLSFVTSDAIRAKCDTTWTCEMYELSSPIMLKIIFFCTFHEFSTLSSAGICSKSMTMSLTDVRVLGFCNHLLSSWNHEAAPKFPTDNWILRIDKLLFLSSELFTFTAGWNCHAVHRHTTCMQSTLLGCRTKNFSSYLVLHAVFLLRENKISL